MKIVPVFVPRNAHPELWEILRVMRNDCAAGLTHMRDPITPREQEVYRHQYNENVRHYLYFNDATLPVGFSRLEWRDGFVYPTYGVSPRWRGHGYAWDVVKHAMLAAGGPLRGDLLDSNEAIKHVDYALGWRPVGGPDEHGVQEVEADWPPPFITWREKE